MIEKKSKGNIKQAYQMRAEGIKEGIKSEMMERMNE